MEELARLREQELRQLRAEHKAAQDWLRERGGELSKSERAIAGQREVSGGRRLSCTAWVWG